MQLKADKWCRQWLWRLTPSATRSIKTGRIVRLKVSLAMAVEQAQADERKGSARASNNLAHPIR